MENNGGHLKNLAAGLFFIVGLGLIVAVFRRRIPLNVDELRKLRG